MIEHSLETNQNMRTSQFSNSKCRKVLARKENEAVCWWNSGSSFVRWNILRTAPLLSHRHVFTSSWKLLYCERPDKGANSAVANELMKRYICEKSEASRRFSA